MADALRIAAAPGDFDTLRRAGKDALSLALMATRNRTLAWVAAFEAADALQPAVGLEGVLWTLGRIAWFQERWIARNVQRDRGFAADPDAVRLAPIEAGVDAVYDPPGADPTTRDRQALQRFGALQNVRTYAIEVLDITLDLLARIDDGRDDADDALAVFRAALFEEAGHDEAFAVRAQTLGLDTGLVARADPLAPRPPILLPATRWRLGLGPPGYAFDDQREPHVVELPGLEIDAQAVSWAQYGEFVEDGGYDEPAHWSADGWAWREREGRRTPRHVEQLRHGVLQRRFGRLTRAPLPQAAVHVTLHEAEAWCRWAGRRLPTEVEWEAAAHQGASRGFRFGAVREWTASTWRAWPGYAPAPWRDDEAALGRDRALRGASFATAPALVSRRIRWHAPAEEDAGFVGFRSCAA